MKTEVITIEKGADGTYSAYTTTLSSVIVGEGNTAAEAKSDFENSYREVLAYYSEQEGGVPEELRDIAFEYKYDLSAFFSYFDFINVSKFAVSVGIEPSLMRHYKIGGTFISREQAKKIESGMHRLAEEMLNVTL